MKKIIMAVLSCVIAAGSMAGCGTAAEKSQGQTTQKSSFDASSEITVISREANSGTRGAFDELMKIVVEENGQKVDKLYSEAVLVDSTDAVSSKVEVDKYAIGYTSLGSVTDKVKALTVDGIEATAATVKSGQYKISRPFVLATKGDGNALSKDFISFVTSNQGQKAVEEKGFIKLDGAKDYTSAGLSGKLTLSGSTSVEKVIEKLKEEYIKLNPNVSIEITYSGSSAGIKDVTEGKVDIGMSSRELKDSEKAVLTPTIFAHDGIAVIVNKENPLNGLTSAQITKIFTGEQRTWSGADK
ncbi:MAG: substrate-binding domain-containing protein [Clostridia bacterium]|nr:substrate-binding domain-containing protein [Clostridia bacterium]